MVVILSGSDRQDKKNRGGWTNMSNIMFDVVRRSDDEKFKKII